LPVAAAGIVKVAPDIIAVAAAECVVDATEHAALLCFFPLKLRSVLVVKHILIQQILCLAQDLRHCIRGGLRPAGSGLLCAAAQKQHQDYQQEDHFILFRILAPFYDPYKAVDPSRMQPFSIAAAMSGSDTRTAAY